MEDWDLIAVWLWMAACVVGLAVCAIVLISDSIHAHRMERAMAKAAEERSTCRVCGEEKRLMHFTDDPTKCRRCSTIEKQKQPSQRRAWVDYHMRGIGPQDY